LSQRELVKSKNACRDENLEVEIFGPTTRGYGRSKERTALRVEIGPGGKPQGWDRHETRPADDGWNQSLESVRNAAEAP
jgi:hypothetical protein